MSLQRHFRKIGDSAEWNDSEPLECVAVVPEAPNVRTFSFRAPSGAWFRFDAGQFITLELPVPGETILRTYTISSSPSRPLIITVTVKAQGDSIGSRWMIDNLKPGDRLKAYGPAGLFNIQNHPADKYLFISAGSGITPMMSMTSYLFDLGENTDICFINCAKRPSEIIFRAGLERMAARAPELKLHFVVDEDDPYVTWTGYRGMFNQLMVGLMSPDYLEREVFCCGPEPFMQAVRDMLNALGYDMDRSHQESFQAPVETEDDKPELDDIVPSDDLQSQIHFTLSDVKQSCAQSDTVLATAKAAGLNIPSGCTFGVCGTCKVKKASGEVHMVHNGGISEDDIDAGYILACCSNPIGAVEIEI